jgi:hypothetical protein
MMVETNSSHYRMVHEDFDPRVSMEVEITTCLAPLYSLLSLFGLVAWSRKSALSARTTALQWYEA